MSTKKSYDGKFVSAELHEMRYVSKLFMKGTDSPSLGLLFSIYFPMVTNKKKVLRSHFYTILELIGYTR